MNLKPFIPGFTPPHLICLACSAAFLLGACSGSNPAGTSSGSDAVDTPRAAARDAVTLADAASLARANDQYAAAQAAVNAATAAAAVATAATGSEADRAEARRLIAAARTAIEAAITAAEAALTAAADGSAADIGNAARARDRANALQTSQKRVLDNALASFAWYTKALARFQVPNGEAAMPPSGGDGVTVEIDRIPRTIPTSPTDSTLKANPKAICGTNSEGDSCPDLPDTFKDVPYEEDKLLFSVTDDAEDGDEFKVGGYVGTDDGVSDPQIHVYTGLKLTSDGIVIRTGGSPPTSYTNPGVWFSDFADTRRDITAIGNVGGYPHGENAWDLVLTFGAPQTMSIPAGGRTPSRNLQSDWTGNGNFYWRSYVPAADSQLETDGEYYAANGFNQPEGYKDLGTYEVWLSNYLGANLQPVPGSGVVRCLDGTTGASCPYDYTHYYLKYAAYGLFVYSADRQTYLYFSSGQKGRIHAMHFGYSAFEDETGKKTTDIGTAITSASFRGHTLAYAVTGSNQSGGGSRDSKLLRGDAALSVSIPSTGNGRIEGNLANFEEWTGSRWRPLTSGFGVTLQRANISNDGTFSGTAVPTGATIRNRDGNAPEDFPVRATGSNAGGIVDRRPANPFIGVFNGSFYGPRDDSADLEVAGSWQLVGNAFRQWEVYGSFGAKQRPAASSN